MNTFLSEFLNERTPNFEKNISTVFSKLEEIDDILNSSEFLEFRVKNVQEHNEMKKLTSQLLKIIEQNLKK